MDLKKIIIISLMFLLTFNVVNATQILVGNESTLPVNQNLYTDRIFGKEYSTLQDETSQQLTGRITQEEAQETLYTLQVLNELGNNTMNFTLTANYFIGGSPSFVNTDFSLLPGEQQALGVLTTQNDQEFQIVLQCTNGCNNSTINGYKVVYQVLDKQEQTYGNAIDTFLGFVSDLIEINVNIWRVVYYVIILGAFFTAIFSLIIVFFKFLEYAEKLQSMKKKHIYKQKDKE